MKGDNMKEYTYIIIGGGMTAGSAVFGIREMDPSGTILMISEENALPYNRPPLSKKLWTGGREEEIFLAVDDHGVDFLLNTSVLSINPDLKRIAVGSGESFSYEKLLLATGGFPRKLPFGEGVIHYYRTIEDFHQLKSLSKKVDNFAIIGAGFIGSELAAALTLNGNQVTLIESGPGIGWKVFPEELVQFLGNYYKEKGVTLKTGAEIISMEKKKNQVQIHFNQGDSLSFDEVVAGVGIIPNESLADDCGLAVKDGIHVNEVLQTSEPSIFSAGDVANFYNPLLSQRIRVEHADNAKAMGKTAGRNMADANERYTYLPLFYSDMFDLGYEAVGKIDSRLEMVQDWQDPFQKGVIYYLEDDQVVGVLLWNVWDKVDDAREIIAGQKSYKPDTLIGLIQ
jgi:3-phenylpropionate/trans-cinnamate dioxygenase ferredoxin reductase component